MSRGRVYYSVKSWMIVAALFYSMLGGFETSMKVEEVAYWKKDYTVSRDVRAKRKALVDL